MSRLRELNRSFELVGKLGKVIQEGGWHLRIESQVGIGQAEIGRQQPQALGIHDGIKRPEDLVLRPVQDHLRKSRTAWWQY